LRSPTAATLDASERPAPLDRILPRCGPSLGLPAVLQRLNTMLNARTRDRDKLDRFASQPQVADRYAQIVGVK